MNAEIYLTQDERETVAAQRARLFGSRNCERTAVVLRPREDGEVDIVYAISRMKRVKGRQSDEALIASLLYLLAEDYSELFATNRFRHVMETAFKRIGIPYEPFGHDALPAIQKHMEEYK